MLFAATAILLAGKPASAQTLQIALDATNLTWTTSGTLGAQGWIGETSVTHDGVSAAQSAVSVSEEGSRGQASILQTTVTGPGTLTFWTYVPDTSGELILTAGNATQAVLAGPMLSWEHETYYIGPGTQTLTWTYTNSSSFGFTIDPAYLDQVSWVTGATAPVITNQPVSQSQVQGLNVTFSVAAAGTPPFTYQWYFNSNAVTGATAQSYTVTNVQVANLGYYTVAVTNATGGTNSDNASLEFGNVTGWGNNAFFQTSIPPGTTNVLAVSAGAQQNLALKSDGTLLAWGLNNFGQQPIPPNLSNIVAVGANDADSMIITADGSLKEWGDNSYGQTSVAETLSNVVAVASGANDVTVVLQSHGTVIGAGQNSFGQTNIPSNATNVVAVSAGAFECMALKSDGTVVVWGSQQNLTNVPPDVSNVVAIATGASHCLALKADGTVEAWGSNTSGVTNVPPGLSNVVAIAAGSAHSLALKADGTIVAWGNNTSGQTNVPAGLSNVVAVAAGGGHSIALVGNGPPVVSAPIQNPTLSGNSFSFSIPSQSGRVYELDYKNNITDPTWTALPLAAGNGTNLVMTDSTATNSQRFYRVRRW